jgi:hypothetical protein
MPNNQNFAKEIILEFLDYIKYKIENDSLTMEEADSIAKTIQSGLPLSGTADDFARFYGKTKTNVTTVIDRKMLSKPRRTLLHSFNEFRRAVPSSWNHK